MEKLDDGSLRAESWLDLHQELFSFEQHEIHGRYRSSFAYRGVDSSSFELETSLMRIENTEMEPHLLRNFKKYARSAIKDNQNTWELLAVAQHYGLPTRLLDWSFSPYVALHFATSDISRFKDDGAIWCLDTEKVHEKLHSVFKDALTKEKSYVFTVDMLSEVTNDLYEFDNIKGDGDDFIICLEPPSIDERIVNQYAMFTLMTNSNRKLNDWLANYPECFKKIIIPSSLKLEVRDKLDQSNINERMIYPGLQGISAWLKRYATNIELMKSKNKEN
ncbi:MULTISPECIES: FRG domain-containing protein [Lysinibacillus]|uniref:FRG domain-containing protein n=1 Tax=Lysinibacillus TaxID=400634 RepID=UPI002DBE89AE|nr:FRG domain-containing protein [Lysinibacillus sphaericus]MEB7454373.1 FRG domain-containing protein [Lysinibacillus sphaericus]WKT76882.1 FRG domain-containing protein [Lysinibacillus fusiformis]